VIDLSSAMRSRLCRNWLTIIPANGGDLLAISCRTRHHNIAHALFRAQLAAYEPIAPASAPSRQDNFPFAETERSSLSEERTWLRP